MVGGAGASEEQMETEWGLSLLRNAASFCYTCLPVLNLPGESWVVWRSEPPMTTVFFLVSL